VSSKIQAAQHRLQRTATLPLGAQARFGRNGALLSNSLASLAAAAELFRWAGESLDRSERGRSEAVVLVTEVLRVTAVPSARCGGGNGHFDRLSAGVRRPAQQRVQPTPPLRPFWA
jgi:hypothetical protein